VIETFLRVVLMGDFVTVAKVSDVKEGEGKVVQTAGKEIALFNVDGKIFAIENECKHMGGPLGEGMVDGNIVTCPWHQWKYDVTSGKSVMNPQIGVGCFEVKVEGDEVKVKVVRIEGGKVALSKRQTEEPPEGWTPPPERPARPRGGDRDRGGRGDRRPPRR